MNVIMNISNGLKTYLVQLITLTFLSFFVNSVQADWINGFEGPPKEQQHGNEGGAFNLNKLDEKKEHLTYIAATKEKPIPWEISKGHSAFLKIYIPPGVSKLNVYITAKDSGEEESILFKDFGEYDCNNAEVFSVRDDTSLNFNEADYLVDPSEWVSKTSGNYLSHKRDDNFSGDSCVVFGFHNANNFQFQTVRVTYTISDLNAFKNWVEFGNNQPPTASFTANHTSGEAPLTVNLDASASTDSDGTISSYEWSSTGEHTATDANTSMSFDNPGTYTITLTVTDDLGLTGTVQKDIIVSESLNEEPIAFFTMKTDGCCSLILDASGSSDEDDGIDEGSYKWSMSSINEPKALDIINSCQNKKTCRIFTESLDKDFYMLQLTVSDNKSAFSEPVSKFVYLSCSQDTVVTGDKPVAKFTAIIRNNKVTLDASESCTSESGVVIKEYQWSDPVATFCTNSNEPKCEIQGDFLPLGAGDYPIELTVTDENGTDSVSHTVTVP